MTEVRAGGAASTRLHGLERSGLRVDLDAVGVLTLTLDNPSNLNAMTSSLADGMRTAIESAGPAARCIVLTGAGRAFCSGQDLRSDDRHMGVSTLLREHYNPLVSAISDSDRPVIAALNGVAAGIGASVALACDIRVATQGAAIAFLFARVGLVADGGTSWFLPRLTSPAVAAELMLRGRKVSAEEARELGLVSQVWSQDVFAENVRELANELAGGPSEAFALIKRQLRLSGDNSFAQQLELEIETQSIAATSPEYDEGRCAFLEKRVADFRGV